MGGTGGHERGAAAVHRRVKDRDHRVGRGINHRHATPPITRILRNPQLAAIRGQRTHAHRLGQRNPRDEGSVVGIDIHPRRVADIQPIHGRMGNQQLTTRRIRAGVNRRVDRRGIRISNPHTGLPANRTRRIEHVQPCARIQRTGGR